MHITTAQRIRVTTEVEDLAQRIGVGILDIQVSLTEKVDHGYDGDDHVPGTIFLSLFHPGSGTLDSPGQGWSMLATQVLPNGAEPAYMRGQ